MTEINSGVPGGTIGTDFGFSDHKMNEETFKRRTRQLALEIIQLVETLPKAAQQT